MGIDDVRAAKKQRKQGLLPLNVDYWRYKRPNRVCTGVNGPWFMVKCFGISGQSSTSTTVTRLNSIPGRSSNSDDDEQESFKPETDEDRRQTLLESDANAGKLRQTTLEDFAAGFLFPSSMSHADDDVLSIDRLGDTVAIDVPSSINTETKGKGKASGHTSTPVPSSSKRRHSEVNRKEQTSTESLADFFTCESSSTSHTVENAMEGRPPKKVQKTNSLTYGGIVQDEVNYRKKELLGMQAGSSRTLGAGQTEQTTGRSKLLDLVPARREEQSAKPLRPPSRSWSCMVCTLCVAFLWSD
jgi:hypothetical protein